LIPSEAAEPSARQVRPVTFEDLGNQETAEKLALQILAAIAARTFLSAASSLADELLESYRLDDDDEEAGEESDDSTRPDDQHKREKEMFDEAIADALDKYPDINAVNGAVDNLPPSPDLGIAQDAEQLKVYLAKCPIGATKLKDRFLQSNAD
jgi:hypothetical protein